jgi:hypothetical protein
MFLCYATHPRSEKSEVFLLKHWPNKGIFRSLIWQAIKSTHTQGRVPVIENKMKPTMCILIHNCGKKKPLLGAEIVEWVVF